MKKNKREHCPICHRPYEGKNIESEHHILPHRSWKGKVPKIILCRKCHNDIEIIINKKEKRFKRRLTEVEYCETILLFLVNFIHHTKTYREKRPEGKRWELYLQER